MANLEDSHRIPDPSTVSMTPIALRWGLITGLILVVLSLVLQFSGVVDPSTGKGNWISMLLSIATMFFGLYMAITKHRDEDLGGHITFGRSLGVGMYTALIYSLIAGVFTLLYFTVIDPEMVDMIKNNAIAQMESQGMSDAEIEQGMSVAGMFMSPVAMTIMSLVSNMFLSFIFALIVAAIAKKDPPASA